MPCTLSIKIEPDSRGLDPAIHPFEKRFLEARWMRGSSGAKTRFGLLPAHDE